jgi:hypothetical protein
LIELGLIGYDAVPMNSLKRHPSTLAAATRSPDATKKIPSGTRARVYNLPCRRQPKTNPKLHPRFWICVRKVNV